MTVVDTPLGTSDFAGTDFTDPRVFDDPSELFAWLRDQDVLHHDGANDLYIAARHEDVFTLSRDEETYCSKFGVRPAVAGDMSIITLDGDEHVRQRRLINKGFTPRRVRELIPHVRELTNQIVDEMEAVAAAGEAGGVEFVSDFAIHIPLIIICEIMGLDPQYRLSMYGWSDAMMAGDGHVEADSPQLHAAAEAFGEFAVMALDLIAQRRASPEDDLISILTQAFDEGGLVKENKALPGVDEEHLARMAQEERLQDDELLAFLTVLMVAGNETTRNAITGGLVALSRFPEQRQLLLDHLDDEEFMAVAIDELVRYVTPVLGFVRTVTVEHTYRGTRLLEGDRVLMLYGSANRDDRVFESPDDLDLTRSPNPHLAFGIGPHFCLGANLARMELTTVFQELLTRLPDITVPADAAPSRGDSTLVLALNHLPAKFTPRAGCPVEH